MDSINIIFPNQLFEKIDHFDGKEVVLIEEFLFFNHYNLNKKKIPIVLINARITKKSYERWTRIKNFSKFLFSNIENKELDICSPADNRLEISSDFLYSSNPAVSFKSLSVSLPIAETTTTTK